MREETLNIYIYTYIHSAKQSTNCPRASEETIWTVSIFVGIFMAHEYYQQVIDICVILVLFLSRLVISYTSRGVKTCWVGFKQTKHRNKHALFCGTVILTHWGRVTHICVSKLTIIGSDNGLSPGRRQAIIRINAGILLIRTLGTNFGEILSKIGAFSFKKMHLKMSSAKWRPFCLGLSVLSHHP